MTMRAADYAGNNRPADAAIEFQTINAPQLRLPTHKPRPLYGAPSPSPLGKIITDARAAAPLIYGKRTDADARADAAADLRRAVAAMLDRAMHVFQTQRRPATAAELKLFDDAAEMDSIIDCCRVLLENSPPHRAVVKRATDRALSIIDRLENYRGTAPPTDA